MPSASSCIIAAAAAIGLVAADVNVPDLPAAYSYQLHYQLNTTKTPFSQVSPYESHTHAKFIAPSD